MVILFFVALVLAWPTAGLSIVAYIALIIIKGVLKGKSRMHHADKLRAQRSMADGQRRVPSWAGDRSKNETFIYGIQNLAMHHGVPQPFLTAALSNSETLTSLVRYAAAMEQQGSSFTEQQMAVSEKLIDMWKSQGEEYAAGTSAQYDDTDGQTDPPSWADDEDSQREFAAGVQRLAAPDGLKPSALVAMFSLQKPLDESLAIAGAVERQGGSFKDQQLAVKNFMVRWWNGLSPDLQDQISHDFENRY